MILIVNTHTTSSLNYQIYGSIKSSDSIPAEDDETWKPIKDEVTILPKSFMIEGWVMGWAYLIIKMKNTVPNNQATYKIWSRGI